MKCTSFGLGAILSLVASVAMAQPPQGRGGAEPEAMKNLQVLPKDSSQRDVIPVMQGFTAALGVQCGYCHVFVGRGNPGNDMASDAKQTKKTARVMMQMVRDLNAKIPGEIGKTAAETTRFQCVMCHRGVPIPKQLVDIVADTTGQKGAAAAVAQYRELRGKFYGAQAYDFSDNTLFTAAQRAVQASKPDDAIAYAQANVEFNPMSARSYQVLSQAYGKKGDKANAVKSMEKAAELDPMNQQIKTQLNELKNPAAPAQ